MSMRLPLNPDPSADVLEAVNRLLAAGGVLAMPTESYYALGLARLMPRRSAAFARSKTEEKINLFLSLSAIASS